MGLSARRPHNDFAGRKSRKSRRAPSFLLILVTDSLLASLRLCILTTRAVHYGLETLFGALHVAMDVGARMRFYLTVAPLLPSLRLLALQYFSVQRASHFSAFCQIALALSRYFIRPTALILCSFVNIHLVSFFTSLIFLFSCVSRHTCFTILQYHDRCIFFYVAGQLVYDSIYFVIAVNSVKHYLTPMHLPLFPRFGSPFRLLYTPPELSELYLPCMLTALLLRFDIYLAFPVLTLWWGYFALTSFAS